MESLIEPNKSKTDLTDSRLEIMIGLIVFSSLMFIGGSLLISWYNFSGKYNFFFWISASIFLLGFTLFVYGRSSSLTEDANKEIEAYLVRFYTIIQEAHILPLIILLAAVYLIEKAFL